MVWSGFNTFLSFWQHQLQYRVINPTIIHYDIIPHFLCLSRLSIINSKKLYVLLLLKDQLFKKINCSNINLTSNVTDISASLFVKSYIHLLSCFLPWSSSALSTIILKLDAYFLPFAYGIKVKMNRSLSISFFIV